MKKNYLLDTSVILKSADNMLNFAENNVYITATTLQEIDSKKNAQGETGFNARRAGRILERLRKTVTADGGMMLPEGGTLYILMDTPRWHLPAEYSESVPDNRIINAGVALQKGSPLPVILVSEDTLMRVSASICGLTAEEVRGDQVEENDYTGHDDLYVEGDTEINMLYSHHDISGNGFDTENEYITVHNTLNPKQTALTRYNNGSLHLIGEPGEIFGGVKPMNKMQRYALNALLDPEIPLVILSGPAGTAKTFLSLAAALTQTSLIGKRRFGKHEDLYRKILISRPNSGNSDPGFGYLPGELSEKMAPLLANYTDTLEAIFRGNNRDEDEVNIQMQIDDLFDNGVIELCPLNFIRGRSLQDSFIICDEAQNATRTLIRDVVTRAGRGSKVVILGDPQQIDAPGLNSKNNGLVYCMSRMKGTPVTAMLKFNEENCVRSVLAETAIRQMRD